MRLRSDRKIEMNKSGPPALAVGPDLLYYENPTLGVGGSEALIAIQLDRKTPFGVK